MLSFEGKNPDTLQDLSIPRSNSRANKNNERKGVKSATTTELQCEWYVLLRVCSYPSHLVFFFPFSRLHPSSWKALMRTHHMIGHCDAFCNTWAIEEEKTRPRRFLSAKEVGSWWLCAFPLLLLLLLLHSPSRKGHRFAGLLRYYPPRTLFLFGGLSMELNLRESVAHLSIP